MAEVFLLSLVWQMAAVHAYCYVLAQKQQELQLQRPDWCMLQHQIVVAHPPVTSGQSEALALAWTLLLSQLVA